MDNSDQPEPKKKNKDLRDEIFQLVANFDEVKPKKKEEPPSQVALEAQAAIDDVQVVIPDGMQVRSHRPHEDKEMV